MVKYLLGHGANVNAKDSMSHWTPLHSAVFKKNKKICALLIEFKADMSMEDGGGSTALDLAETLDAKEIIAFLKKHSKKEKGKGKEKEESKEESAMETLENDLMKEIDNLGFKKGKE